MISTTIQVKACQCLKCNNLFIPRFKNKKPKTCPICNCPGWYKPKLTKEQRAELHKEIYENIIRPRENKLRKKQCKILEKMAKKMK